MGDLLNHYRMQAHYMQHGFILNQRQRGDDHKCSPEGKPGYPRSSASDWRQFAAEVNLDAGSFMLHATPRSAGFGNVN